MLKVFATDVVVSKGYEGAPALKYGEKGDSVRFRIGKRVYDAKAEHNTRWVNLTVKAFGPVCERIRKMKLREGSYINLLGRLDEDTWTDQGTGEVKSMIINLQTAHYIMLTRPLLYTAITRGKERVIIVGERKALCMAIKKVDTEKRGTCLADRIKKLHVTPGNDCFVATARVYPSYKDPADCYLAEATASRGYCKDKPSVSPREWAQTAAVGIALRNAGFGLQFSMAGEDFADDAPNELAPAERPETEAKADASPEAAAPAPEPERELTMEEKYEKAIQAPCPISKYSGKTLGEVLAMDPKAMKWIAEKFTGNPEIKAAAQFICEYAVEQASA